MKKEHTCSVLSLIILLLGIIFTISGALLQTLPFSSKSALLIFSFALMMIGIVLFAVHYKRYNTINNLITRNLPVIAQWSYSPNTSETLKKLIKEQKTNSLATAILILILSIIFSIIFAYSGSTYILWLGYIFAILCILVFIIAIRFISAYYKYLSTSESIVLFGEDYIYFLDELYTLNKSFYLLENVNIYIGVENLLIFEYGLNDIDSSAYYTLTIPIPPDKLNIAIRLKDYYRSILKPDEDE